MNTLKISAVGYVSLRERLIARFPELAEDEQALLDTLEGESDLNEQIILLIRSTVEDEASVEALKAIMARMSDRCKRIADRAKAKRSMVAETMAETGVKKITAPDFTISQTYAKQSVVVSEVADLPSWAIRTKTITEPDKDAIRIALAQGPVPGASFSNAYPTITVRTA